MKGFAQCGNRLIASTRRVLPDISSIVLLQIAVDSGNYGNSNKFQGWQDINSQLWYISRFGYFGICIPFYRQPLHQEMHLFSKAKAGPQPTQALPSGQNYIDVSDV